MTSPPAIVATKAAAPERHRVDRKKPPVPGLTQAKRDQVARMFMAEFPGMSGAEAVRRARDWLTEPERCMENVRRDGLQMSDRFLARLMAELPNGAERMHRRRAADPRRDGWRQR